MTPATNLVFFSMLMFFGHYWSLKHTTAFYIVPCIPFLQCSVESPPHQCDGAGASLLRAACIPRAGRGDARAGQHARLLPGFSFLAFRPGEQRRSKHLFIRVSDHKISMRVPGREVPSQRVSVFLTLIDIRLLFNKAVTIHISASPE